MSMPELSIIIVNWNTRDLLLQCIKSILKDCQGITIEIIVSDNASTDNSAEAVMNKFPEVMVLCNKENLGFAKGNNIAIKKCTGKLVCLINTDVEIIPGCFRGLMNFIENNPGTGIVGPQALYADKKIQLTARKEVTFLSSIARVFCIDMLIPSLTSYSQKKVEEVDVLAGCFWMIRREALDKIGLLDENFFFYGEDRDYCKRMWLAGWKVVYNPEFKIFHYEAGSSRVRPFHYYQQLERAYLKYWEKYHSGISVSFYYLIRISYHILRYIINLGAYAFSLLENKDRIHKALRSWYCVRMLIGLEKHEEPAISTNTVN